MKKIQMTERDQQLLKAINQMGFVEVDYIVQLFKWSKKSVYRRLKKLIQCYYLQHERVFYQKPGVYRVTAEGVAVSHDTLAPLRRIHVATYHHHLGVAHLSLKLVAEYGGEFISERQLRHELGIAGLQDKRHVPDGILRLNDQRIAIELELTVKSESRLKKIIQQYRQDLNVHAVWYFCGSPAVKTKLDALLKNADFITTRLLIS